MKHLELLQMRHRLIQTLSVTERLISREFKMAILDSQQGSRFERHFSNKQQGVMHILAIFIRPGLLESRGFKLRQTKCDKGAPV